MYDFYVGLIGFLAVSIYDNAFWIYYSFGSIAKPRFKYFYASEYYCKDI
jgi:hypothetical protein